MIVAAKVILFLLWVNGLPPLANMIWGERFNQPMDGGRLWFDGRPILGSHKTIRGLLISILGGAAVSPFLGLPWWVAAIAASLAMAGDMLTSFIKRRLDTPSGKDRFGLDQFFESAFPLLFLNSFLRLSLGNIIVILLFFTFTAYRGSHFWHYIIYRPPLENYPRVIRSTVRLREWRACHQPLARWHSLLNLTSFLSNRVLVAAFFRLTGTYERGLQNTLAVQVKETSFTFPTLPRAFHRFRILLLTDLHLDGLEGLTERIIDQVRDIEVDLCLIGGDIRMETYGPVSPCLRELRRLLPHIRSRHGILGVLGNHDCIEMTPDLEEAGVIMLINDSCSIERDGEQIWVAGVDDPHYYRMDDAAKAFHHVPADAFKIFLAHSPEAYKGAANFSPHLYLCGHTHGGQIRLPGGKAILTNSRVPRFTSEGKWNYQGMKGYTCRGAGSSGVPLRFNCPGEISLITMHRKTV